MSEAPARGKTIWEMVKDRLSKNGSDVPFLNPLDLRINTPVLVSKVNGPEFDGFTFSVKEIREYVRQIDGKDFGFTDYVLAGTNAKTFNPEDSVTVRLRLVPNLAGAQDALLLRIYDELAFDPGFLEVLKDTTGIFEVRDNDSGTVETYSRINDLKDPYDAAVMVITGTTEGGKAPPGKVTSEKLEYWDYWREIEIGGGKTAKQYAFVEMNSDTGWFQIWRGTEFFP